MRFEIQIAMDNQAFEAGVGLELARILDELAGKVEQVGSVDELMTPIRLRDYNGNRVGFAVAQDAEVPA